MNKQLLASMSAAERELLIEVHDGGLTELDEDALVAVHTRVRRARDKYSKLYRRQAAARVQKDKSRGKGSSANQRTARKAEVFEDALAKVSRQLARMARASSDRLKQDRLAAARGQKKPKPGGGSKPNGKAKAQAKAAASLPAEKRKERTPASKRSSAQARAATRRKQAKRSTTR